MKADDAELLELIFNEVAMYYVLKDLAEDNDADLFIIYDTLANIYQAKGEVDEEEHFEEDGPPEYVLVLDDIVDYLEIMPIDSDDRDITNRDMVLLFDMLRDFYDQAGEVGAININAILPVMSSDFRIVFAELSGGDRYAKSFEPRDGEEFNAQLDDLMTLYSVLSVQYSFPGTVKDT